MTTKLYYEDAYIKEFEAEVLSCEATKGGYAVVLNRTAFFPEEGGQSADGGFLGDARVLDVRENGGVITHITDRPLQISSAVIGRLDFDTRFEKMQIHTAEHIISGIIHSLYGFDNVGFHLGEADVTFDTSGVLTREMLDRVEVLANEAVYRNLPVIATFPSPDMLSKMQYRAKLDLTENVRIVTIGDVDACACCAPHVAYTGEIGMIRILEFEKHKGGLRIRMLAGRRALLDAQKTFSNNYRVATMLSVKQYETAQTVEKLKRTVASLEFKLREAQKYAMECEAAHFVPDGENAVVSFPEAGVEAVRAFVNAATRTVRGVLVALYEIGDTCKIMISSHTVNLKEILPALRESIGLLGGGSSIMLQGTVSLPESAVCDYFSNTSFLK